MSGSRAIAAAINRRTNAPSAGFQTNNAQQQASSRQREPTRNTRNVERGMQQPVAEPKTYPKLSVSDAIALTTIRLGRVENFINALPPLEQIGIQRTEENVSSLNENIKIVDEAVFKSIVLRLDKVESKIEEIYKHIKENNISQNILLDTHIVDIKLHMEDMFAKQSEIIARHEDLFKKQQETIVNEEGVGEKEEDEVKDEKNRIKEEDEVKDEINRIKEEEAKEKEVPTQKGSKRKISIDTNIDEKILPLK